MRAHVIGAWLIGALSVSGCASLGETQASGGLHSRVALLEERVSQLEQDGRWMAADTATTGPAERTRAADEGVVWRDVPAGAVRVSPGPFIKPSIRDVQQALQDAGLYDGRVDGRMGPLTRSAIREFQRIKNLKVDGIVGRRTWGALGAYLDRADSGEPTALTDAFQ